MSTLSMIKIRDILRQRYELNSSYRGIARSLNISLSTVGEYLRRAKAADIRWPLPEGMSDDELRNLLFLPSTDGSTSSKPQPDWAYVHIELAKKGMTLLLLWREYKEQHNNGLGYTQFCKHYQTYRQHLQPVMRQRHKAGEKVFVDYAGMTMPWLDANTGEIHEAQIFVGTLGASHYTFVHASASQQLPDWLESHRLMFDYFGGVSEVIVPDNLKSAVTKTHRYDPDINANYQQFSEHYGIAIVPARPGHPKDKAVVENAVGCIERQVLAPLPHHTFTSLTELNTTIGNALTAFNVKRFQKMDSSRAQRFEQLDKPALKPLPKTPYQYAHFAKATVNIDYHIAFENNYYSVPHRYIKKKIIVRATHKTIECLYQNQRIAVHARSHRRYQFITNKDHMPKAHLAQCQWTPERLIRWAEKSGDATASFVTHLIESKPFPQQAYRACLGLLRLGKRFGQDRLDNACQKALQIGAMRYQHVETILKNKLEEVHCHDINNTTLPKHHNIRGADYYR